MAMRCLDNRARTLCISEGFCTLTNSAVQSLAIFLASDDTDADADRLCPRQKGKSFDNQKQS